jgi:hypothetical protein
LHPSPVEVKQTKKTPFTFKERTSISLALPPMLDLDTIREEAAEINTTTRMLKSIREAMDSATLKKIDTCRALKLPILKDMTEEECLMRYV